MSKAYDLREEMRQMVLVSRLYYEDGLNQQEVAEAMGVSRPIVSRLLMRARQEQIVTISVVDPFDSNMELAERLCAASGLREAIITPAVVNAPDLNLKRLGISAARHLEKTIKPQDIVGVGWGRTLYAVVQSLQPQPASGVMLVPLIGGLGQVSPHFQVNELIRIISDQFDGDPRQLFLPAIVQNEETKKSLLGTPDSQAITATWNRLTTALVGIGNVDFDTETSMLFVNYLDEAARSRLRAAGAVGDIGMRFFDQDGAAVMDGLRGVISIHLEQLRQIPDVIAVACGAGKARAILGAIRGRYIDTLVTDDQTAISILALIENGKIQSK